jgi:chemotaxis protein MotB
MKKSALSITVGAAAALLLFAADVPWLFAQFKWTSDYKNLYNEKVAVELELTGVKRQYANEKSNSEARIKDLESQIANLGRKIEQCEKQGDDDRKLCDGRVKELQSTIDILQKKGGDREKDLLEENKKLQARYEGELQKLRQQLIDERDKNLKEMDAQRRDYELKISELRNRIDNLNGELDSLKKLTQTQKSELDRMSEQANELEKQLQEEIKKGDIRLKKFHDRLVINIDDRISFDSGSAELKKGILPALDKITKILVNYQENRIIVEGHTDNVPIRTKLFRDNWQLSTERALAVLNYILENRALKRSRFSAAGYGEYNPLVSNETPANRALNRRVDIVVVPRITK